MTTISFEFFPPKTEAGTEKLRESAKRLAVLQPEYVSVTCGAGGSAIDGTTSVVNDLRARFGFETVPHVAIARQSRKRVRDVLGEYKKAGIRKIVAIRGDASQSSESFPPDDLYPDTIEFVNELAHKFALDPLVAAYPDTHPQAQSPQHDMDYLKRKVDAGAAVAITQFFFLAETFLRFRDKVRAAGIKVPLAPGIMPIHNLAQAVKFATGCGTIVPNGFDKRFEQHGTDEEALFNEGVAHTAELCDHLRREGVEHIHFYTLNRHEMTHAVCKELGLGNQGSGIGILAPNPDPRPQIPGR